MPFSLVTAKRARSDGHHAVASALEVGRYPRICISVLQQSFREAGWQPGMRVTPHEGTEEDGGCVFVSFGEDGMKPVPTGRRYRFLIMISALKHHSVAGLHHSTPCEISLCGGGLLIRMPEWFRPVDMGGS